MSRRDDPHGCWADWDYDQAIAAAYAAHLEGECDPGCDWCKCVCGHGFSRHNSLTAKTERACVDCMCDGFLEYVDCDWCQAELEKEEE